MERHEELVRDSLISLGFDVQRFPKTIECGRAPDFRVTRLSDDSTFYCEVKSIDNKMSEDLPYTRKYNVLTSKICDAAKQFESINPQHLVPNALAIVSNDPRFNPQSFREFLQGAVTVSKGGREEIAIPLRRVSGSRAWHDIAHIDLFMVIYGKRGFLFLNDEHPACLDKLRKMFQLDNSELPFIPIL